MSYRMHPLPSQSPEPQPEINEEALNNQLLGEHRDIYYKVVAKLKDKYYSIFDGKTQYDLGKIMHQKVAPNHGVLSQSHDCLIGRLLRVSDRKGGRVRRHVFARELFIGRTTRADTSSPRGSS